MRLEEAAAFLKISKSALNRMENAQVIVRPYEANYILNMYGVVNEEFRASLLGLAAAGRSKDWTKRHGGLLPGPIVGDFVQLEQDSLAVRIFQPIGIPGLLQTPEYSRAVIHSAPHDPGRDIERSVAFRMARQEVLSRTCPIQLDVVVSEAALRQALGGASVLQQQLQHLLQATQRENVSVRVLSFNAPSHPGFDGPFTLLDVETGDFTIVVIDSMARSIYLEDDAEVDRYSVVFEDLCSLALSEVDSRDLIVRLLRELEGLAEDGEG